MVSPERCLEYMSGLLALFSPFRTVGCTCLFVDTKAWWVTSLLNPAEKNPTLTVKGGMQPEVSKLIPITISTDQELNR